jgi:hypothetical protein
VLFQESQAGSDNLALVGEATGADEIPDELPLLLRDVVHIHPQRLATVGAQAASVALPGFSYLDLRSVSR